MENFTHLGRMIILNKRKERGAEEEKWGEEDRRGRGKGHKRNRNEGGKKER